MHESDTAMAFEVERARLVSLARRLLGSPADAEDVVQDAWLRLEGRAGMGIGRAAAQGETGIEAGTEAIGNLPGWLTTVVTPICLDHLRARRSRPHVSWEKMLFLPDDAPGPDDEVILSEAVGQALLVVLDTLAPAEQLALILHDVFGLPFEEIADILGKSRDAAKMTASRARGKVRGNVDPGRRTGEPAHRRIVEAFLAAGRSGDIAGLVALLHPDVTLHADTPAGLITVVGTEAVAGRAAMFAAHSAGTRAVRVDGMCGVVARGADGSTMSLMTFVVVKGLIVRVNALADPDRLGGLSLPQ